MCHHYRLKHGNLDSSTFCLFQFGAGSGVVVSIPTGLCLLPIWMQGFPAIIICCHQVVVDTEIQQYFERCSPPRSQISDNLVSRFVPSYF